MSRLKYQKSHPFLKSILMFDYYILKNEQSVLYKVDLLKDS